MKPKFRCESLKQYGDQSEAILFCINDDTGNIQSSKIRIMMDTPKETNFFQVCGIYTFEIEKDD